MRLKRGRESFFDMFDDWVWDPHSPFGGRNATCKQDKKKTPDPFDSRPLFFPFSSPKPLIL